MIEKKNEVMTQEFHLVTLTGNLTEAIMEELDGLGSIPFDHVKIPSGGGLAFELPGEEEDTPESVTELIGVILDHYPVNAYWANQYTGGKEQPDCSSFDGKQGVNRVTGEKKDCITCPYNQFGSDNKGKACKNVHRIFLLREGNPVPLLLTLPPTSLKYLRDYIAKKIILKGLRCWQVLTKITLKKEKNAAGIVYSRAVFSFIGKLTPEQSGEIEGMRELIKTTYRQASIEEEDYSTTSPTNVPKVEEGEFISIPEGSEESLPF